MKKLRAQYRNTEDETARKAFDVDDTEPLDIATDSEGVNPGPHNSPSHQPSQDVFQSSTPFPTSTKKSENLDGGQ